MSWLTIFVLAYFGIYLVMAPFRGLLTLWGFLFRDWPARIIVGLFIVFVYSLFQENPVARNEVLPEQQAVPTLQLSDIMIDDLKDSELHMEPVVILGQE